MAAVLGLLAGELALNGCARHPLRVSWELAEPPKRLTIDSTVSYDPYFEAAPRNALAKELFELFHHGRVDLAAAPQGHRLDDHGGLAADVRARLEAEGVPELRQLAYPSQATHPGENFFPNKRVDGFREAWSEIISAGWNGPGGRPDGEDALHVETHLLEKRDIFITDDEGLLTICCRLRERGFPVTAMRLSEYFNSRRSE